MNDLMLSSLKTYWERLRAGRIAPYRAEIDPRQFESALENMFIVEKLAPDNMRIRLAGMKICEMMGMEVRGMQPGFLIDEPDRDRFDRLLNVVMAEPAVVELQARRPQPRRRLPRHHAADAAAQRLRRHQPGDRLHLAARATLFAPPLAFAIEDVSVTPVEPGAGAEPKQAVPGFAEPAAEFAGPAAAEAAHHRRQPERARPPRSRRIAQAPGHRRQVAPPTGRRRPALPVHARAAATRCAIATPPADPPQPDRPPSPPPAASGPGQGRCDAARLKAVQP